jgi:hypothetical protein
MHTHACRACRGETGHRVLDLGDQPACDFFPRRDDPRPDPLYPLQMWLCASCGLAQLLYDPTIPEEPKGAEPAALVAQAQDAVDRVAAAGLLPAGATVTEYGSPHGGSWLDLLASHGLTILPGQAKTGTGPADVVVDCFGLMHAADQAAAVAERAAAVAPGGLLLLQYHSLQTIVSHGQWNALRHGHYAYYSTTALSGMLGAVGFRPRTAWWFELYGGTVLLAASRASESRASESRAVPDNTLESLVAGEERTGVRDPAVLGRLELTMRAHSDEVRRWLVAARSAGQTVLGYGAASRAVALLCQAGVGSDLLPAVADASPAKQGLRMPGTDIPIISPAELTASRPDTVLLFVPDLMKEVTAALPEVGRWVDVETLIPSEA